MMTMSLLAQESYGDSGAGDAVAILVGFALLWVVFGGGIGALIGKTKGRGGAGFFLGLFLGWIGWIVAATLSRTPLKEAEYQNKVAIARGQYVGGTPTFEGPTSSVRAASPIQSGVVEEPARWATDPFDRHDHRWFDGRAWTDRVSDAGVVSFDAPVFAAPSGLVEGKGWAPDPFLRFPQRYYDATGWTAHVSRDGETLHDWAVFASPSARPAVPPPPRMHG